MGSQSFIAQPTSRKNIRTITNFLRDNFGLTNEKYFPIVQLLEFGLHLLDKKFNFEVESEKVMGSRHGVTYPEQSLIVIREDVYLNACDGIGRDRFTIAHEVGHFIMHLPRNIALARTDRKELIPTYSDPEWQANTFAGELLAPPHVINGLSVHEIMKYCGVSDKVANIQISQK
jgi:Zn-dependent peptidase ImmA (M78 family)